MRFTKSLKIALNICILGCYCATFLVLSVGHIHELPLVGHSMNLSYTLEKQFPPTHPLYCALCLRINSAQIFFEHPIDTHSSANFHELISNLQEIIFKSNNWSSFSNRAPPPSHILV